MRAVNGLAVDVYVVVGDADAWSPSTRRPSRRFAHNTKPPCQVQEIVPERLVIEVHDERVHDGTADGGREHRRRHPGPHRRHGNRRQRRNQDGAKNLGESLVW
jgi:predicted kinase